MVTLASLYTEPRHEWLGSALMFVVYMFCSMLPSWSTGWPFAPVDQPAVPMLNQSIDQPAINKGSGDQPNGRLWMLNRDQAA